MPLAKIQPFCKSVDLVFSCDNGKGFIPRSSLQKSKCFLYYMRIVCAVIANQISNKLSKKGN